MTRVLILLTLPKEVRDAYASRIAARFPELEINVVDHFSKASPFMVKTDVLISFGPMLKDEVFRDAQNLKWCRHSAPASTASSTSPRCARTSSSPTSAASTVHRCRKPRFS